MEHRGGSKRIGRTRLRSLTRAPRRRQGASRRSLPSEQCLVRRDPLRHGYSTSTGRVEPTLSHARANTGVDIIEGIEDSEGTHESPGDDDKYRGLLSSSPARRRPRRGRLRGAPCGHSTPRSLRSLSAGGRCSRPSTPPSTPFRPSHRAPLSERHVASRLSLRALPKPGLEVSARARDALGDARAVSLRHCLLLARRWPHTGANALDSSSPGIGRARPSWARSCLPGDPALLSPFVARKAGASSGIIDPLSLLPLPPPASASASPPAAATFLLSLAAFAPGPRSGPARDGDVQEPAAVPGDARGQHYRPAARGCPDGQDRQGAPGQGGHRIGTGEGVRDEPALAPSR